MKRWTPKLAVARSRRNLDAAIARLRAVSAEWYEVDEFYVQRADELAAELEAFRDELEQEISERLAAGEHIGL